MKSRTVSAFCVFLVWTAAWAVGAAPADPSPASRPAAATAPADQPPREQSIYVPYEKLWQVFEKKGRGVFLPYEEFMQLWQTAEGKSPRPAAVEPPVPFVVAGVSGEARVVKDVLEVTATLDIEVLKAGWHRIPVRLGDVAVTRATIDGEPARLVRDPSAGYQLLLNHTNSRPRAVQLRLDFAKAYEKSPGRNRVGFEAPSAPISRWDIRIPESGVKVEVFPLLAAADAPATPGVDETHVLAFVGATPQVRIEWTPRAEGAKGLQALANARAEHMVWVEEGVTRCRVRMAYEISRTELSTLSLEVPAGHKVVNVFDANVREWKVTGTGSVQEVTASLFEPTKGAQNLIVELERFGEQTQVAVPVVRALNVTRQQGVVVVRLGSGLRAEPGAREGLLQLDARELPASLGSERWDFSYRYAALPFGLTLNVEKVRARIVADTLVAAQLQPEELVVDCTSLCDVQRAGVFQFEWLVPAGVEIRQVTGLAHGDAAAAQVDRHHVAPATNGIQRLTVNLSAKASGRVGVLIELRRALREPDLLAPTGKAVALPIPLPRAAGERVERDTGRVIVFGPESLRLNPSVSTGLRSVTHAEASQGMPVRTRAAGLRPVLAFAYSDQAAALTVSAERRAPHVTVRQLLVARIEAGVVKYEATLFYDVLYSGVKSLRLDLPADLAGRARLTTADVRHMPMDGAALADLAPGSVAWRIEGETEFLGAVQFRLQWEDKIEKLDIGRSVPLQAPRLVPRGVDRAWGQVVLAKAETIDVTPAGETPGLRPVDPAHDLMPGAEVRDAALAFEFHADWSLAVNVTRYEPQDVKATSIERGLVRMVVTRSDATSVQALYRVRSARQRLSVRLPDGVQFDTQPLRIDGRPVALEQGQAGEYLVPLVAQQQDQPFLLELRYVVTGAGLRLAGPSFPNEPAVQKVYLSVFLPENLAYLGSSGPWNDEFVWVLRGFNTWPRGNKDSETLLNWVAEGLSVDRGALRNFATDGRHVLYSTLRPAPGDAGALRITVVRAWVFQALWVAALLAIGLVLLPARAGRRALAAGAGLSALALAAVFAPSLARATVNNATVAAGFVVAVIWALWFLLVTVPRSPFWQQRARDAEERRRRPPRPPSLPAEGPSAPPPLPATPAEGGQ